MKHSAKHPPVADSADVSCENEDAISFHFNLPATELALRSISVINSVPELRFDASPKVPTITEEDVATICRLASEETRPEFLYVRIPESHPFYGRHDKNYCPKCLQRTSMGVTLYEADYIIKCLLIGMQSNKEKTKFWSWQKKSNLDGLATVVNFPKDKSPGSVFMSRESARKEKNQNEIAFPQEPKIVVDSNLLYSKYIIYHNKTLFHKMPKLIKLSLSAEWLKEEKISPRWMMTFTSEPSYYGVITSQNQTKEAPTTLIPPQSTDIRRPMTQMTEKTVEEYQNRSLVKQGQHQLYGWLDHSEIVWYDEDGKGDVKHEMAIGGDPPLRVTGRGSFLIPSDAATDVDCNTSVTKQKPILQNSHKEFTGPSGSSMSVDVTRDDNDNKKDGKETKESKRLHPPPHLSSQVPKITHTTTVKEIVDDYMCVHRHLAPYGPIRANSLGLCKEVSAREIPVNVEQRKPTRSNGETRRVDQYFHRGSTTGIQAQRDVIHGMLHS